MATQPNQTKKLSPKRRKFVRALTGPAEGNRTKAAMMAGYKAPRSQGSRLLTFVDVQKAIDERLANADLPSAEEITTRLALMAEGQIPTKTRVESGFVVGPDGEATPVDKTTDEYDRLSPTNSLAKIRGLLKDKEPTPPAQVNVAVIQQLPDGPRLELFKAFLAASE